MHNLFFTKDVLNDWSFPAALLFVAVSAYFEFSWYIDFCNYIYPLFFPNR